MNTKTRKQIAIYSRALSNNHLISKRTELPHQYKGFTVKRNEQKQICPFYSSCVVDRGLNGQVHCIMSRKVICDKHIKVRECENKLNVS